MKLLLVAQSNLTGIVNLCAQCDIFVQIVLSSEANFCIIGPAAPRQLNTSIQIWINLVENRTRKLLSIATVLVKQFCIRNYREISNGGLHVGMYDEFLAHIVNGKLIFMEFRLLTVKCSLISSQPSLVTENTGHCDRWPSQVDIHVSVQFQIILAEWCLDLSIAVSRLRRKRPFER